jgi:hypothetical protein
METMTAKPPTMNALGIDHMPIPWRTDAAATISTTTSARFLPNEADVFDTVDRTV